MAPVVLLVAALVGTAAAQSDPYADGVWAFEPGESAGFGQERMPFICLGPPRGAGAVEGGTDVVSLGDGGSITLAFRDNVLFDGPGADLVIFENAFHSGSESGPLFTELAFVQVSVDRRTWLEFPFDSETGQGLAGRTPVFSNPDNAIDPLSSDAGGDRFDIAELGLEFVRYVRIVDVAGAIPDPGDLVPPADKGGFDLDAVAAINSAPTAALHGTISSAGIPVAGALVIAQPSVGGRKIRRRSGTDGSYVIPRLTPSGEYFLRARKRGRGRAEGTAFVDLDQTEDSLDLVLE